MSDSLLTLKSAIEHLSTRETLANPDEARRTFLDFRGALTHGEVRAAEKVAGHWVVNAWVKQGILLGFRLGDLQEMSDGDVLSFVDKDTFPARRLTLADRIRLVPGGSSIREGAYVAPSVICMPPMFINVGAYVDEG
jgi:2,3,4,5-tetrahydropyridine-2-carboxylate N-succinyltransferase